MIWNTFETNRDILSKQYEQSSWNDKSGLTPEELELGTLKIFTEMVGQPKSLIKARLFEFILLNSQIEVNPKEWFADKLNHCSILMKVRGLWQKEIDITVMKECIEKNTIAEENGAYIAHVDFGHTTPEWSEVYKLGIPGLLKRIQLERDKKIKNGILTEEQKVFYESTEIVYKSVIQFIKRLSEEAKRLENENEKMCIVADSLNNIASREPRTILEVIQLTFIFFMLQENVEGERLRSLGGIDRLYYKFYKSDLDNRTYNKEQIKELIKYFLCKFHAANVPFGLPFFLGGIDEEGNDATNELSYLIAETYSELSIHSPKIHIRYHENMSDKFIKLILSSIRKGNSSFLFINDRIAVKSLMDIGIDEKDARNYVPIGCYEQAAMGREVACTGNGSINIPKAVEAVLFNGVDPNTSKTFGIKTGELKDFNTFDDFYFAVKKQFKFFADSAMEKVSKYEKYYMQINPSPLFSSTMPECVEKGWDAYASGAKYNNSSLTVMCLASVVDSLYTIKKEVYEDKVITLKELTEALKNNWDNYEMLRLKMKNIEKYGNNNSDIDALMVDLSEYIAECVNNKPNGRGGVFRCGLFSIDFCHKYGLKTGATPDGRKAYEPLSKNLCAVSAMDKKGITALISSVTKMDLSKFSNGSVLDIILHPSAVQGEDGINAMFGILKTYMKKGGLALHGNVFDVNTLKKAQKDPEKYATLQVRVCGWNVYFVNLSKAEQDEFIKQAEYVS